MISSGMYSMSVTPPAANARYTSMLENTSTAARRSRGSSANISRTATTHAIMFSAAPTSLVQPSRMNGT